MLTRRTVRSSWFGCPAPLPREVYALARSYGVGIAAVRSSRRSFSYWVLVCSFASESQANQFRAACGDQFFGWSATFFYMRQVGKRWRVSVPVLVSQVVFPVCRGRLRLGQFRIVTS